MKHFWANLSPKQRLAVLLVPVILLAIIIAAIIFNLPDGRRGAYENSYGTAIPIADIDRLITNVSTDKREAIQAALTDFVRANLTGNIPADTYAVVRSGTLANNYDSHSVIYYGSFIVDIENLRQSYKISYEYSPREHNANLSGYPIIVSCVPDDRVIYTDFECHEPDTAADHEQLSEDPVLRHLPHQTDTYNMFADYAQPSGDKQFSIVITILLTSYDYNDDINVALAALEQKALDYLTGKGVNYSEYNIILRNSDGLPPQHQTSYVESALRGSDI